MAADTGTVWAIDIGNSSLKALNLSTERGVLEVIGFDNIRHGKILSGSDVTEAEKEELIALSLRQFVNKYDLSINRYKEIDYTPPKYDKPEVILGRIEELEKIIHGQIKELKL